MLQTLLFSRGFENLRDTARLKYPRQLRDILKKQPFVLLRQS